MKMRIKMRFFIIYLNISLAVFIWKNLKHSIDWPKKSIKLSLSETWVSTQTVLEAITTQTIKKKKNQVALKDEWKWSQWLNIKESSKHYNMNGMSGKVLIQLLIINIVFWNILWIKLIDHSHINLSFLDVDCI